VWITISVKGRFHAFDLAREIQRLGYLNRMITSYPAYKAVKYGVERDKVQSLFIYEGDRVWRRAPRFVKGRFYPQHLVSDLFDLHASRHVPEDTDIFVGWSSSSLHSLRRAKRLGAKTVVERGSSHILHQRDILLEEYDRFGLKAQVTHPKIVEKELAEYAEADYVSVPSQYAKKTFLGRGVSEDKLIHVPYGVDLTNFYPVPKRDNIFRVIHCGAISIRKGVHYLLQAFSELKLPRAELWLIGSMTDEIRPFLVNVSSAVFHKGPFPESELRKYYAQGSVFCLASIEEGFSMVLSQAMACGLPVICTTNTGGEDIVRDGQDGSIVPIRDVEALKEKILFFYENRDVRKEIGYSAQQRVKGGFTWAHYGNKMVAEYQRILDGSEGSHA
jgi:glycosyltransferase involved in cell wall biosynthesis